MTDPVRKELNLREVLTSATIKLQLTASTRDEVLRELVELVPELADRPEQREILFRAFLAREQFDRTGLLRGIALPGLGRGGVGLVTRPVAVFGRHTEGIPYDPRDEELVRLFLLVLAPTPGQTVELEEQFVAPLLVDEGLQQDLLAAESPEEVLGLFREAQAVLLPSAEMTVSLAEVSSLSALLSPATINLQLTGNRREEVFRELVRLIPELADRPDKRERLVQILLEHHEKTSIGVGFGVANLGRMRAVGLVEQPRVVFGRSVAGLPFGAVDDQPVHLFFLRVAPTYEAHRVLTNETAALLERLQAHDSPLRRRLLAAESADEVIALIREAEAAGAKP